MSSATSTLPTELTTGTWTIDPSHSEASFQVRHAGIAKVRGSVKIVSGAIVVGEDASASSVTATLDPTTITTGDANRDGHLKSADFFEVDTYPEWTFASAQVTVDGDDWTVVGDLTVHGVIRAVTLAAEFNGTATDPYGNLRAGFSATTSISRKDFNLTWNTAIEGGGVLVGDKVGIELEISAIKQS